VIIIFNLNKHAKIYILSDFKRKKVRIDLSRFLLPPSREAISKVKNPLTAKNAKKNAKHVKG
jgi:hypothetical protein